MLLRARAPGRAPARVSRDGERVGLDRATNLPGSLRELDSHMLNVGVRNEETCRRNGVADDRPRRKHKVCASSAWCLSMSSRIRPSVRTTMKSFGDSWCTRVVRWRTEPRRTCIDISWTGVAWRECSISAELSLVGTPGEPATSEDEPQVKWVNAASQSKLVLTRCDQSDGDMLHHRKYLRLGGATRNESPSE
jgi:hypothetical protein